jgi:hypothetical protein
MISDTVKLWESEETGSHFMMFSFSRIKNATDRFSTENKLGEGGFGPVYKVPYVLESGLCHMLMSISKTMEESYSCMLCTKP